MQEDIKERTVVETMKDNIKIQKQNTHTYTQQNCAMTSVKKISLFCFIIFLCVVSNYYMEKYCGLALTVTSVTEHGIHSFFCCFFLNYLKQKHTKIAIIRNQKTI